MTGPNLINRVAISATNVALSQTTGKMVSGTANAIVDNRLGRFSANKVDEFAGKVLDAPAAQHAAVKAESIVTNVINSVPVVKNLATSLFEKVNSFIAKAKLKSPEIKAYKLGMELLTMAQSGKTDEEIAKHTKTSMHIIKDDLHTPASKVSEVKEIEGQIEQLGVTLRAADNAPFAKIARRAISRMKGNGIDVPEIRLSNLFHASDRGYTDTETLPSSAAAVFLNAKANWVDAGKMSEMGKKYKTQSTSAPEHPIYNVVGQSMYNGIAGTERLVKSGVMPEKERLAAQGIASNIETPADFMGEIFAHLMDGNEVKKEHTPLYKIYEDWGGKIPKNINITEGKNTTPSIQAAAPLQDLDITF